MALAALILAGEHGVGERPPLLFKIAGQTLLERLFRQMKAAGANHIVLLVTALPADVLAIVDRMTKEGLSIDLARSAADAADRIHPDERLIIVDGPLVIEQSWIDRLRDAEGSTLVTVAASPEAAFERIDAKDDWLGLACLDGEVLRSTASQLGDWALGPTVLRRAVQSNATRLRYSEEGIALRGVRPVYAEDVARARLALGKAAHVEADGWYGRLLQTAVMTPVSKLQLFQHISYSALEYASILLYFIAIVILALLFPVASCFCFALAAVPRHLARTVRAISVSGRSFAGLADQLSRFSFVALPIGLAWLAERDDMWRAGLVLAVWVAVQWLLGFKARGTGWLKNEAEGLALLLGVGAAFGQTVVGLILCIGLLVAEQALDRREISTP